jgi:hypothetical protein
MEDGYRTQQATRPQTLSYAMMDSPVGVGTWLIEKFSSSINKQYFYGIVVDTGSANVVSIYRELRCSK